MRLPDGTPCAGSRAAERPLVPGRKCTACCSVVREATGPFCPVCGAFDRMIDALVPAPPAVLPRKAPPVAQKPLAVPAHGTIATKVAPSRATSPNSPETSLENDPDALVVEGRDCVALGDVPEEDVEVTSSHLWALDRVLAYGDGDRDPTGGAVIGGTVILAGEKGVGKTTVSTSIAAEHVLQCRCGHRRRDHRPRSRNCDVDGCDCTKYKIDPDTKAFVASGEERLGRFLVRCRRRLYYTEEEIQLIGKKIAGCQRRNIEAVHAEAERWAPTLLLYDSMPKKFVHPDCRPRSPDNAPKVMDEIVDFASAIGAQAWIVARLREDGQVQGGEDWQYDSDGSVVKLQRVLHPQTKAKTRYVRCVCTKNRWGREDRVGWLLQAKRGIVSVNPPRFLSGRPDTFSGRPSRKDR